MKPPSTNWAGLALALRIADAAGSKLRLQHAKVGVFERLGARPHRFRICYTHVDQVAERPKPGDAGLDRGLTPINRHSASTAPYHGDHPAVPGPAHCEVERGLDPGRGRTP